MNGAKRPQMLLTSEKMASELRHATGAQTTFTVDVRNGCSVVCAHACPVTALSGDSGQGVLLATQGSLCANAVEGPSTPLTLHAHCTWYPILGLGREASAEAVLWRFSTAWYGTVRYGSVRVGLRFHRSLVPLEWVGLFTRRYNCGASTAVTSS